MIMHSRQGDMHRTMINLHEKYGKLVRTGPNEVSVSDLSAIKLIYGAGTKFRKSDWYSGTFSHCLRYHQLSLKVSQCGKVIENLTFSQSGMSECMDHSVDW